MKNKLITIEKSYLITKKPAILMIHLNRIKTNKFGQRTKNTKYFKIPFILDLKEYLHHEKNQGKKKLKTIIFVDSSQN